jgi:biopolymer transport protein ExbD
MADEVSVEEESEGLHGINVTPLVDVSLVLVLIFMVTSPFMVKPLMPVKLPQAVTSQPEDRENITVSISPEDGFAINEIPVERRTLAAQLKRQIKASGFSFVLIRADERVPHGDVQDVMKIAKEQGARRIAFAIVPKGR